MILAVVYRKKRAAGFGMILAHLVYARSMTKAKCMTVARGQRFILPPCAHQQGPCQPNPEALLSQKPNPEALAPFLGKAATRTRKIPLLFAVRPCQTAYPPAYRWASARLGAARVQNKRDGGWCEWSLGAFPCHFRLLRQPIHPPYARNAPCMPPDSPQLPLRGSTLLAD
jgi:hypothetical protein